ncbi:MAG: hypothetical protein K2M65_00755 [Muribaculaceae bacterium]|nr:hypothetical protein [Muribaculaceae bacterium]
MGFIVVSGWNGHTAQAQSADEEYRFEGCASVGLNTDGVEWAIGVAWFPIPYFSFKVAIGLDSEIRELSSWGYDDEYSYGYDYDDYCARFQFCPSIELRTPSLIYFCSQGFGIQLFASPGIIMSPRAAGSHSGEWLYWNMRGGLMTVINERCTLQLGYGYSSFNLYAGAPISHWGYDEGHHNTHSIFVTFGYKF